MADHLAALVTSYGRPDDVIRLARLPCPELQPGMVEITIERTAINPSDLIPVTGAYSNRTVLPFVPGFEGVGTVSRVAADVTGFRAGDRVLPLGASGLWQTRLQRPAEWCFAVPDDLSNEQAATAYINPMTTLRLVAALQDHFGGVSRLVGIRIGVTAAGSAIGRMLLTMLSAKGADVTAIVRSDSTRDHLPALPRLQTLVSGDGPLDHVGTFDAVVDAIGGEPGGALFQHNLSAGGVFLQYGALSGMAIAPAVLAARPDIRFSFLWLRTFVHSAGRQTLSNALSECFDGLRGGTLTSEIAAVYPLSRLREALAHHNTTDRRGKVLIDPRC